MTILLSKKTLFLVNRLLMPLLAACLMVAAPSVKASDFYLTEWSGLYPSSATDDNAGCLLCHGSSTRNLNPYGRSVALCSGASGAIETRIEAVEGQDADAQGDSNLVEINADTQPGWTVGDVPIYNRNLCDDSIATETYPGAGEVDPAGNQAPIADANGPYFGTAEQQLTFDGSGSEDPDGTITAYDWTFGDGNIGTGVSPTHTYDTPGIYDVTLVVTDDGLETSDPSATTASIEPAPQDPVADPNGPYTGTEGVAVVFDGSASFDPDGGVITQYDWDFGDGNTGTGVAPSHAYISDGSYTVTLTVVDDEGAVSAPVQTSAVIEPDQDSDGIADSQDNCILVANGPLIPDAGGNIQLDTDGDNYGNICDPDFDNDLFVNAIDLAYFKPRFFTTDPDADLDGDGIVNAADLAILKLFFFKPPGPSGLVP
jgi:chitodextrinase